MEFFLIFYNLLSPKQKINFYLLICFSIIIVFLELLSIGLVIPLISIILDPNIILTKFIDKDLNFYSLIENILYTQNIVYYFLVFFVFLFLTKNILFFLINYLVYKFVEDIEVKFSSELIYRYLSQKYPFFIKNYSSSLITKINRI